MANDQSTKSVFTPVVVIFFLLVASLALVQGALDVFLAGSARAVRQWATIIAGALVGTSAYFVMYKKFQRVSDELSTRVSQGKSSEERLGILAHALESISEAVNITDAHERFIYANRAFEKLYGYTSDELLGKSIDIVRSARTTEEVTRVITPSALKGEWHGKLWNRRKDGTEFFISLSSTAVRDEKGHVIAMVGTASDITDDNREELRLRRLELALERSGEAILMTDVDGRIEYVNPAFEQLYGYSAAEVLGKNPRILKSGRMPEGFYTKFWITVLDKETFTGEWLNRTKQGSIITVEATINPILNASDMIIGYLGIQRDISERKRTAQQLQASLIEKNTLLREIYHRIKNNLNIVASVLGLQASAMADKERARPLEETRERILAMAQMHDALFNAGSSHAHTDEAISSSIKSLRTSRSTPTSPSRAG
ncbi:MAG: PAS domain S-box protein [Ignavibacteriales bacterium]|nr:PAS domain S-box protein [Ignavibacteriales bacterium]